MKKIYIDFDHTLYCTTKLKQKIIDIAIDKVNKVFVKNIKIFDTELDYSDIYSLLCDTKSMFEFCNGIDKKYKKCANFKLDIIKILKANNYIYSDSIEFLKKLKNKGFEINILTYSKPIDFDYQMKKIISTNILKLIDNVIICSCDKSEICLDYKNGIFIDDNANVLDKLYSIGVTSNRLYKICRPDGKYSNQLTKFKIKEYNSLDEINVEEL